MPTPRYRTTTQADEQAWQQPEYGSPAYRQQLAAAAAGEPPQPRSTPDAHRRRTLRIGGAVATLLVLGAAWSGVGELGATERTEAAGAAGVPTTLVVRVSTAAVRVETGAVDRPTFTYRVPWPGNAQSFRQTLENGTLTAELGAPSGPIRFGLFGGGTRLTVTLPAHARPSTLRVEAGTGSVRVTADADDVTLSTSTGSVALTGSATNLTATTGTGSVDVTGSVSGLLTASASTGSVNLDLTGAQPTRTTLNTGTGSIHARLPEGTYAVSTRTGTGSVHDDLVHDDASPYHVEATTGTGSINLG